MRWQDREEAMRGKTRTRKAFLFLPKCIQNEWRWWETVCWTETYWPNPYITISPWEPGCWLDDSQGET